ncbi:head-tail connector protein [Paenibacillus chitinolyticus]|uniref:head-tail connector protein n=1 Tax=Paenibacillus chitinolyticus TaxID=79263 RepID=UPI002DB743E1|nr:head-tail connector protein [Paenibacillus chitinolyticus]MEC0248893.1 head-tail connector protein [Paenibacillus chitinolyticus]
MELTLDELKKYLRIDGSEDDDILAFLVLAAKEYLLNAGIPESNQARYKLAVMVYVALYYENRDPSMKIDKLNVTLESLILQLK